VSKTSTIYIVADQLSLTELQWQIRAGVIGIIHLKVTLQRKVFFKGQVHNKLAEDSLVMTAKKISTGRRKQ